MQGVSKYPCTELRACIGKTRHRRLEYPNSKTLNSKMYLNVKRFCDTMLFKIPFKNIIILVFRKK